MALKAGRVGVNPNYVDKEGRPLYDNSYLKELLRKEGIITLFTKEGNPISIDNAVAGRVYDLVVTMTPKQAGTGTPSPTNVRAISGYTGLTITVNGTDIERDFDTTVYGGTDDVTGEGAISEWGLTEFDGSNDEIWAYTDGTTYDQFYIQINEAVNMLDVVANEFVKMDIAYRPYQIGIVEYGDKVLRVSFPKAESVATDAATFKTWLSSHPLQVAYKLATPTSIPLTPQKVNLDVGSNTVSSDTGTTMDLKYLGTLVPGGANGRSLNRSLNLNREVIAGDVKKEIQEEIKEEVKEVPVEEPVTTKKSTKKSTK